MLSNNDSTGSTGIAVSITPRNAPVDIPVDSTPTVHKQSTAIPYTSGHVMRDENLGNEMVGYVVGPMPAKKFLKLLPRNNQKPNSFDEKPFAELVNLKTEVQMYDPFVRIPSSLLYP